MHEPEVDVDQYVQPGLIGRVNEKARNPKERLTCEEIRPRHAEKIGEGRGRCTFLKEDKIVKVAKNQDGIEQNKGAILVQEKIDEHSDVFAMPEHATEEVVIQEKAGDWETVKEEMPEESNPELAGILSAKIKRAAEEGIVCDDHQGSDNLGYIDGKGLVVLDLGRCEEKREIT